MRTGRLNSRGLSRLRLPSACCSNVSNRSLKERICASSRAGRPKHFVPRRANAAQKRRIDNEPAEWIDKSHVKPRQAAGAAHVNPEIEAVGISRVDQGAQRRGVRGAVDYLAKLFVLEAVHGPEKSYARTCWRKRF